MKRPQAVTDLIDELKRLPGIGQKTAERLSFFLMRGKVDQATRLATAIHNIKEKIILCSVCHGITESDPCGICSDTSRNQKQICVVEEPHDVYVMENMGYFKGVYHVLMGVISPLDGIGPDDLNISSLVEKVKNNKISEVIFALGTTMEGDTTNFYIYRQISDYNITTSTIARGISVGDDLEYADEITLGRSITDRIPFEKSLKG